MKTIKQVEITAVICEGNVPEKPSEYPELTIYYSAQQGYIALKCLCGCGSFLMLPVNTERGWSLTVDDQKRFTLTPSILQHNCGAHYILAKNKANFV